MDLITLVTFDGALNWAAGFITTVGIFAILTLALNIQWGYTGIFNFGVAAFFMVGAFTAAVFTKDRPAEGDLSRYVGGFGEREDLIEGYMNAGGPEVTLDDLKFWELLGSLKWGIMCMGMYDSFNSRTHRSVERAAIGRRSSEAEIDILNLLREER